MSGDHEMRGPDRSAEPRAEREFDDVRRAYAALGDEPVPPLLDARVLAKAREAVRPKHTRPRWLVPASLAATVLVAVGVALDVRREASRTDEYDFVPAPGAPAGDAAPAAEAPAAPLQAPAPSAGSGVARESARTDRAAREQAPVRANAAEDAARAEPVAGAAPAAKAAPATEAVLAPAPSLAPSPMRAAAPPPPSASAGPPGAAPTAAAPEAAAPAAPAADAADATGLSRSNATSDTPAAAASRRARAPASEAAIVMPKQSAPASVEQRQEAAPLPPEEWLAKIDALRRQGRTAEADAELARFRRAYPDYALR